jgi:hypothetical protein
METKGGRGRGVCGTTRETSCRGVCCACFLRFSFYIESPTMTKPHDLVFTRSCAPPYNPAARPARFTASGGVLLSPPRGVNGLMEALAQDPGMYPTGEIYNWVTWLNGSVLISPVDLFFAPAEPGSTP